MVFEKEIPYAGWGIKHNKECWIKLDKQHLETVNNVMGGEFIHYFYQQPIRLYKKSAE